MNEGKRIDKIYLELLPLFLKRKTPATTGQLHGELKRKGLLTDSEKDRKSLVRALSRLEEHGILTSTGGRGRGGKRWELSRRAEEAFSQITKEEGTGLLVLLALLPDEYRELPIFSSVERIAVSVSKRLGSKRVKDLKEKFYYQKPYTMRFTPISDEKLSEIVRAIIEEHPVEVIRKELPLSRPEEERPPGGSNFRKLYPISLFYYDGNFYLGALRRHGEGWKYRTYLLASLKLYSVLPEGFPKEKGFQKLLKEKRKAGMDFPEPRPFLFKVLLSEIGGKELKLEGALAFTTQIEARETREGGFEVLLVGYAEPRFCSEFLQKDFLKVEPLKREEFERVSRKEVAELFKKRGVNLPLPPRSFKKNQENFESFVNQLKELIKRKEKALP
jgi:hypothetical protein